QIGALCNDTRVLRTEKETKIEGDPTEAALTVAYEKAVATGIKPECLDFCRGKRRSEIPFESQNMFMATAHQGPDGLLMFVKGSSDALLERCTSALDGAGELVPLARDVVHSQVNRLAHS